MASIHLHWWRTAVAWSWRCAWPWVKLQNSWSPCSDPWKLWSEVKRKLGTSSPELDLVQAVLASKVTNMLLDKHCAFDAHFTLKRWVTAKSLGDNKLCERVAELACCCVYGWWCFSLSPSLSLLHTHTPSLKVFCNEHFYVWYSMQIPSLTVCQKIYGILGGPGMDIHKSPNT